MINTSLEITENEYLIKFNRNKFDLSFIRNLLRIVEISNPSEDHAISDKNFSEAAVSVSPDYYSHLDEK
ncbi:hypothetical protein [Mucilaginibacter paludis]|uniref:Uncharacterized protein n=1 Tax=Mucilaginibacter paludis DSM 18603 TaxID=714943 RepID=H1YDK8_9SPHI|nr:hypothetical protein [Mucilaginibacter paludis]EHQ30697.1 hypothetical protein Mucpa_6646 [Mucilaginibacter paludis DSM 18603]